MCNFIYVKSEKAKDKLLDRGYKLLYRTKNCWVFANKKGGEQLKFESNDGVTYGNKICF